MKIKEFDFSLDVKKHKRIEDIVLVENDRQTARFNINLMDGNQAFLIGENAEVSIAFQKSDDTYVEQECMLIGNKVIVTLVDQVLTKSGKVMAEVIIRNDEQILTTASFGFHVRKNILNDGAIESTNEIGILNKLIDKVKELAQKVINSIPRIGDNGNWFIEDKDTGNPSRGEKGEKGEKGEGLDYSWQGTKLGVKKENEENYSYTELQGLSLREAKIFQEMLEDNTVFRLKMLTEKIEKSGWDTKVVGIGGVYLEGVGELAEDFDIELEFPPPLKAATIKARVYDFVTLYYDYSLVNITLATSFTGNLGRIPTKIGYDTDRYDGCFIVDASKYPVKDEEEIVLDYTKGYVYFVLYEKDTDDIYKKYVISIYKDEE